MIEELITEKAEVSDKESYYNEIISTIIRIGRAEEFIAAISELIQRLVVDHLHIVGDIYDRGPGPHLIMDKLLKYHSDGGSGLTVGLQCKCDPYLRQIWKPGYYRRWLWYQFASTGYICYEDVQG